MKPTLDKFSRHAAVGTFLLLSVAISANAAASAGAITSHDAEVDGVKLHYMIAGHGPAVVLIHGYAETSRMWRPIIPLLAEKFTVIAPDLPGIGTRRFQKMGWI
jgi:alpha-beta hydrolase superfamily lysophospholipase